MAGQPIDTNQMTDGPTSAVAIAGEAFYQHLTSVLGGVDESYAGKLTLINTCYQRIQDMSTHLGEFGDCLQIYPILLQHCFSPLSQPSPESQQFLRECVQSLHHFLITLIRTPTAQTTMLIALGRILHGIIHPHPFVSEFFAQQWLLLFHGRDPAFEAWSIRVIVELLRESGPPTTNTTPVSTATSSLTASSSNGSSRPPVQPQQQWFVNSAQAKLVEVLAQMAPSLSFENQMFLFRHFNLLLQNPAAFNLHSADPKQQLPLAVQSAFFLCMPTQRLHPEIQQVLYAETLPCCLVEIDSIRATPWAQHVHQLNQLMFCLELLLGFYKSTNGNGGEKATHMSSSPPPPSLLLNHIPSVITSLQAMLISLSSTFCNLSIVGVLPSEAFLAIIRAFFHILLCERVMNHIPPFDWANYLTQLKKLCHTHSTMRPLLGEVLVGLASYRPPTEEAIEGFFSKIQPLFQYLLTPLPLANYDESPAFESFFRFTLSCHPSWTKKLKELIPHEVHPRLVAFVQARGKQPPLPEPPLHRPSMLTPVRTKSNQPPTAAQTTTSASSAGTALIHTTAASIDEDAKRLEVESMKLEQQLTTLAHDPATIHRRHAILNRSHAAVTYAETIMQEVRAELIQQPNQMTN